MLLGFTYEPYSAPQIPYMIIRILHPGPRVSHHYSLGRSNHALAAMDISGRRARCFRDVRANNCPRRLIHELHMGSQAMKEKLTEELSRFSGQRVLAAAAKETAKGGRYVLRGWKPGSASLA